MSDDRVKRSVDAFLDEALGPVDGEKANPNPLPGIAHDFHCTHEPVLCACYAAELVASRSRYEAAEAAGNRLCRLLGARRLGPPTPQERGWDDDAIAQWNAVVLAEYSGTATATDEGDWGEPSPGER